MIPHDIAEKVVAGVRAGRYSLLLGSGFSAKAQSPDGRYLPIGSQLAEELAREFSLPPGHPLPRLWGALLSPDRERYLEKRLKNCRVSNGEPLPIHRFVWRSVYTFNVDDVVEQIYGSTLSQQELEVITHKNSYSTPDSLATVRCIHLHGSVLRPDDGYVFSTADYGAATAKHSIWGPILADELATTPFLVIGCSLDEYDLEHHLARRGGIDASREPTPSLFITPFLDQVLESTASRYGLIVVRATAEEFFNWLQPRTGKVPSTFELIFPSRTDELYFDPPPPVRDMRIFHRQFLHVDPSALPQPLDYKNFLSGTEPTWKDIVSNYDVIRQDVSKIMQLLRSHLSAGGSHQYVLVAESPPGCGKSTVLHRVAFELSRIGIPVFYLQGLERLSPDSASSCISRLRRAPVLVIDSFGDHADQIAQLCEALEQANASCMILGADRENVLGRMRLSLTLLRPTRLPLSRLSESEALELIRKIRSAGMLGKNAKFDDQQLLPKASKKDLIVAMCEIVGDDRRFDELVKSQWSEIPSMDSRSLLSAVSLAHSCGVSLKFSVAQRCASASIGFFMKEIGSGSLQGLIFREGYAGEYVRTAHRVLAEKLLSVALTPDELFNTFVNVAIGIAPYVSRDSIKARKVEARLGGKLLDYDSSVYPRLKTRAREFYQRIKPAWAWNSRYWEQLALLELGAGNHSAAITYAQQAVGIEAHPHTYTTLGHVLVKSATATRTEDEARKLFLEGVEEFKRALEYAKRFKVIHAHTHHAAIVGAIQFFKRWNMSVPDEITTLVRDLLADAKMQFRDAFDWDSMNKQWERIVSRT